MPATSVLLIEDNPADVDLIAYLLRACHEQEFALTSANTLRDGLNMLAGESFDAVLLDLSLPDAKRLEGVQRVTEVSPTLPVVVLTGLDDTDTAMASLQHGVQDYLSKDRIDSDRLVRSLRYAIERKRITEDAARAYEALQRAERLASIGTLAGGIAHEINNPILAAWTSAQAAMNVKDDPNARELLNDCLENIVRSVQRCRDIVENVLRFARQGDVRRHPCDLQQAAQAAVSETRPYAEAQTVTINCSPAAGLPLVIGNRIQLQQLVAILLRNAVEASEDETSVDLEFAEAANIVRLCVKDSGRGMSPEVRSQVFDPFFTRGKHSGTGLGLSIAHGIVKGHQGTIEIETCEGQGTVVTVDLPKE